MDLAGLLRLLRRQWVLVSVIMLIAGSSAFLTWDRATPSFRANATMSVLPPRVNVEGVERNPFLEIASASNADIAQQLSIQLNGTDWRSRLNDEGFSPEYLVDHGDATTPVLRISIETGNRQLSIDTLEAVMDGLAEQLAAQQERFDVNGPSRFTIQTLDQTPGAVQVFGNRTRLTGAILVLGVIAAVIAAQALDNFQRSRRGEQHPAPAVASTHLASPMPSVPAPAPAPARSPVPVSAQQNAETPGIWVPRPIIEDRPASTEKGAPAGATAALQTAQNQAAGQNGKNGKNGKNGNGAAPPPAKPGPGRNGSPLPDNAGQASNRLVVRGSPATVTAEVTPEMRRQAKKQRRRKGRS